MGIQVLARLPSRQTNCSRKLCRQLSKTKMADSCELPLSRVKTIMKSSPDVNCISQEALFLAGKATEMFIQSLAQVSLEQSTDKRLLRYNDLAEIVDSIDTLQFLQDIIPKKIKAKVYLDMLKKLEEENGDNSDET